MHKGSCLPDVLNSANFSGRVDDVIQHTASLVSRSERISQAIWWFNFVAFAYHVFMLTMVNGGYFMLFSASFPETLGVIAMSVFCAAAQLTASLVSANLDGAVVKSGQKPDAASSNSFGESKDPQCVVVDRVVCKGCPHCNPGFDLSKYLSGSQIE